MPSIRLDKKTKTIKVVNRKENIRLQHIRQGNINLAHTGKRGPQGLPGDPGEKGDPGYGIPAGGDDGQVLVKDGAEDFSYRWHTPSFTGDKTAFADFNVTDTVMFNHNLNKYPAVSVMDSTGDEVEGDVEYVDTNSLIVRFMAPFSGRVTCN